MARSSRILGSPNRLRAGSEAGASGALDPILSGEGVSWETPEGRPVLRELSFHLGPEKTGLVGANGSGKTTLARLLVGELEPTRGVIRRRGEVGWLPQTAAEGLDSVAERLGIAEILDAVAKIEGGDVSDHLFELVGEEWDVEARARVWLDRLGLAGLSIYRGGEELSGGEAMRVALAGSLLREPDLLVLDEPTNHLDSRAREFLYQTLDEHRGGLLVISHDRALLRRLQRTLELSSQGLRSYGGGFDFYREQVVIEEQAAKHRVEAAEKDLARQRRAAQEAVERQARRGRSGRLMALRRGRSKLEIQGAKRQAEKTSAKLREAHQGRLERSKADLERARSRLREDSTVRLDLSATEVPAGRTVLHAEGVNMCFDGSWLWPEGVDLRLVGPARWAISGPSGCGKSTLARLAIGELAAHEGKVRVNETQIAWLDQRARLLPDGLPLLASMRRAHDGLSARDAYWGLDRFGLGRDFATRRPETLSGGERMRAALACLWSARSLPRLLVLDEPTNNLDLPTVEVLEGALAAYRGALIVISHDVDFIAAVGVDQELRLG